MPASARFRYWVGIGLSRPSPLQRRQGLCCGRGLTRNRQALHCILNNIFQRNPVSDKYAGKVGPGMSAHLKESFAAMLEHRQISIVFRYIVAAWSSDDDHFAHHLPLRCGKSGFLSQSETSNLGDQLRLLHSLMIAKTTDTVPKTGPASEKKAK